MVSKTNEIKFSYKNRSFKLNAKTAEPLVQWLENFSAGDITEFIKKFRVLNDRSKIPKIEAILEADEFEIICPSCEDVHSYKKESFYHYYNNPYIDCIECCSDLELDVDECPKHKDVFCKNCDIYLHYFQHEINSSGYIECFDCEKRVKVPKWSP